MVNEISTVTPIGDIRYKTYNSWDELQYLTSYIRRGSIFYEGGHQSYTTCDVDKARYKTSFYYILTLEELLGRSRVVDLNEDIVVQS